MNKRLRLAILISGGGTTAEAAIKACQSGRLNLEPVAVISSKKDAGGIEKAKDLGVKVRVIRRADCKTRGQFGEKLLAVLKNFQVDLVSQNGWMPLTPKIVVAKYARRIINQHPGPLDPDRPDFGGRGMYGSRVSCARVAYEWVIGEESPWTEATVHYVTDEYDRGGLIRRARMNFAKPEKKVTMKDLANDSKELLIKATEKVQKRLLSLEHENVIEALLMMIKGQDGRETRESVLIPEANWDVLRQAKELAIKLFPKG